MKAILVIDMPDACEYCQLRNYNQCYGLEFNRTLIEKWDGEDTFKTRNKICPLRPMPDRAAETLISGLDAIKNMESIEVRKVIRTE